MAQGVVYIQKVEITPSTTGQYVDVDVSSYVPSGTEGVIIEIRNYASGYGYQWSVRRNGDTVDVKGFIDGYFHFYCGCGVDANRILEIYRGNASLHFFLVGYVPDGCGEFINQPSSITGSSSWADVNANSYFSYTPKLVFLKIKETGDASASYGLREKGSTDTVTGFIEWLSLYGGMISCNSSGVFQIYGASTTNFVLMGCVYAGKIESFVNAISYSPENFGQYVTIDLSNNVPRDTQGVFLRIAGTGYLANAEKYGDTEGTVYHMYLQYFFVGCSSDSRIRVYLENKFQSLALFAYTIEGGQAYETTITEKLAAIDFSRKDTEKTRTDTLKCVDLLRKDIRTTKIDNLKCIDLLKKDIRTTKIDTLKCIELLKNDMGTTKIDVLKCVDLLKKDVAKTYNEYISLLCDLEKKIETLETVYLKLSDVVSTSHMIDKQILNSLNISDVLKKDVNIIRYDAIHIIDSLLKDIFLIFNEGFKLLDILSKDIEKRKNEFISLKDEYTFNRIACKTIEELLSFIESELKKISILREQTISLNDAIKKDCYKIITETCVLNDAYEIYTSLSTTINELFILNEHVDKIIDILREHNIAINDTIIKNINITRKDNISVIDYFLRMLDLEKDEALFFNDYILRHADLYILDNISLSEFISKHIEIIRECECLFKDYAVKDIDITKQDVFSLSDYYEARITAIKILVVETLALYETIKNDISILKDEILKIDDAVSKDISLFKEELISTIDSVFVSISATISDILCIFDAILKDIKSEKQEKLALKSVDIKELSNVILELIDLSEKIKTVLNPTSSLLRTTAMIKSFKQSEYSEKYTLDKSANESKKHEYIEQQ